MDMSPSYLIVFLIFCSSITNGAIFTEEQKIQVKEFVQAVMTCKRIPGLSMSIVKGEERWSEGYGVADMSSGRAVTSGTLFGVGSMTKAFTVSMLASLMEEDSSSSFSWETPLVALLGKDFRLGDDYISSHVTLKDLLTHRTGLSASILKIFTGAPDNMTLQLLEKRIRYLPIDTPFRDRPFYNDFMYSLAGRVIEVMGGASWEELLRTRMLQPMNMTHTELTDPGLQQKELSTSYMENGEKLVALDTSIYTDINAYQSSGGLLTSADDMTHWMYVLLHQGITKQGTRILSEKTIRTMQTAKSLPPINTDNFLYKPENPVTYTDMGYGFAWYTGQYRGYQVVHHPGGLHGFTSLLMFIHDLDLSVFIATNGPGYDQAYKAITTIFYYVTDLIVGLEPWVSSNNACSFVQNWINSVPLWYSPDAFKGKVLADRGWTNTVAYLGLYGNMLAGDIIISKDGHGLSMKLNRLRGQLHRTANDSVLVGKTLGVRQFMSIAVDGTQLYTRLKFLRVDDEGRYHDLLFTFPGDSHEWSFRRGVRFDRDL